MFERYLSDALTTYFGSFVENLDANKVRLSAWKGKLVLSDLVIRPNALDLLVRDCPVEIQYGKIGNLELSIPWTSVLKWSSTTASTSDAMECCVVLSDVHILVTPKKKKRQQTSPDDDDDDDEHELSVEEERAQKQQIVQRLLDAQLFERVAKSSSSTTTTTASSSRWQWARELAQNLLSNLSVTVRNIHFRYEDAGRGFINRRQHVRESFAVGITLRQFSVQTLGEQQEKDESEHHAMDESEQKDSEQQQDNDDKQTPTKEEEETLPYYIRHKLAAADQLAVYWDRGRGCHLMTANVSNDDDDDDSLLFLRLNDSADSRRIQEQEYFASAFGVLNGDQEEEEFRHLHLYNVPHAFVLSPVSPSMEFALVTLTTTGQDDETDSKESALIPPSTMNMTCPPCCLTISANTLEDTAYLRKSLAIWSRTRKSSISEASVRRLTGLRPSSSPLDDAKAWWKYAVEATLLLERKDEHLSNKRHWRPRGWAGLVRAIQTRRRYVGLYETALYAEQESEREAAHVNLLKLEDDLLLEEIVAFRLAVYSIITKPSHSSEAAVAEEASGRTWSEWVRGKKKEDKPVVAIESFSESEHVTMEEDVGAQLSPDHRRRMYLEMTQMLEREESNQAMESSFRIGDGSTLSTALDEDPGANDVVWKTCVAFKELSLQVNERIASKSRGYQLRPVVRLSCAAIQHQTLYRNDSWEVDGAIASLQVVDLTGGASSTSERAFPVLVGRKSGSSSMNVDESDDSVVIIGGMKHPLSASVSVRRTAERDSNTRKGRVATSQTTTSSVIRLKPLEVVYSTNPVAALARALSTVKTPELTDDYHRMASVMAQWRNKQKSRLLQALAHRRKKIVVDVDIAAPVVLIPEDPNKNDSPLLVVDLGRLRFSNTDESIEDDVEYDDKWQLALDEIQVQCSSTVSYRMKREISSMTVSASPAKAQKLVEPFSLHFIITTRIANDESGTDSADGTILNVYATLPRLVFNLKSSAVRLVERLKLQWAQRAHDVPQSPTASSGHQNANSLSAQQTTSNLLPPLETASIDRRIKFSFSAPLIGFRLDNDVDGRGLSEPIDIEDVSSSDNRCRSCPLVDLALRGIRGEFVQTIKSGMDSTSSFDACLKSVTAVDLYEKAGEDFAFLLSSLPPSTFLGLPTTVLEERVHEDSNVGFEAESNDLVSVQYISSTVTKQIGHSSSKSKERCLKDTLSITFNELYVEWNPETIAAIHKGMMLPKAVDGTTRNEGAVHSLSGPNLNAGSGVECGGDSDDEFYDAIETDVTSSQGDDEDSAQFISEISSRVSSFSEAAELAPSVLSLGGTANSSPFLNSDKSPSLLAGGIRPFVSSLTSPTRVRDQSQRSTASDDAITLTTAFHVKFKLSALRVNFNKDSRHRRVLTAEMDDTDVFYVLEQSGRSNTKARIGNLSFVDPSSTTNLTLYKEILGLKSDSFGKEKATSLLEMDLSMNPRTGRVVASDEDIRDDNVTQAVSVDCRNGTVHGADISVSLRLSPMRFVYLQQLWLEIIDYFFEAIVGYEVWGKQRPLLDSELLEAKPNDDQQQNGSRLHSTVLRSDLPGLLAEEFSFTRFDVQMDEPMILIPVSYQSPHFLRLEFSSLTASNHYAGTAVGTNTAEQGVGVSEERAQWYNNCHVQLNDLKLTSWEGSEIGGSSAGSDSESSSGVATSARIRVNWPVGKYALSVVPKWKVDCDVDRMVLTLRRESYALLQHIIVHNIGELSRHVEEWNALQNLPLSELESYKKEIMVHFGYDKKDSAPTTYAISVKVPSIRFVLLGPRAAPDTVMEANCSLVEWQMRRLLNRIGQQQVTCDIALTRPGGHDGSGEANVVDLLIPVEDSGSYVPASRQGLGVDALPRELTYTSTSQPSGDNVRTLEIVNACIFAVYPAWMNVKRFFSSLPEPDFMNPDEVGLAMQIGDRWYRIGGNATSSSSSKHYVGKGGKAYETETALPSYQFRLLLKSPRIVLSSESTSMENTCVVLRMNHFDFFHHNDAHSRRITKTFFVHDLGLFTSSIAHLNRDGYIDKNSLIRPWCIAGLHERCDPRVSGPCEEHSLRVKADVLQARAAYSDMSVAIDVALQFLADLQQESQSRAVPKNGTPSNMSTEEEEHAAVGRDSSISKIAIPCEIRGKRLLSMELDGFELQVIDDSMRHFADAQQLIKFELQEVSCYQLALQQDCHIEGCEKRTKLCFRRINVFDCLQPQLSPFRLVASSGQSRSETALYQTTSEVEMSEMASPKMAWLDFRTSEDSQWGFCVSQVLAESVQSRGLLDFCGADGADPNALPGENVSQGTADLVELHHVFVKGVSDEYAVNLRPITLQWNPSTVIALQRFLGRLHKEARTKSEREWVMPSTSSNTSVAASDAIPTRARFRLDHLTVLLNKEHQHRCLVEATLSDSSALIELDVARGMFVEGSIKDLSAWDIDTSTARVQGAILEENRRILQVIASNESSTDGNVSSDEFLRFHFKTFVGASPLTPDELPSWVSSRVGGSGSSRGAIDDYLSVSIATLRICYIRERTEEIVDYLSNGLPGKGMGATSRAAKGFINKRLQTKSYLELNVRAPQVYVPQHEETYRGILFHLGDVSAKSWFEEDTDESDKNKASQAVWYRVLSVSLTGLRWNANERNRSLDVDNDSAYAVPLNLKLILRKPTRKGNAVVIRGSLSCIETTLTYTTFVLLKAVMRDNVSREIDVTRWDNVEKAYWMEVDEGEQPAYSSNARFIRYGKERKQRAATMETDPGAEIDPDGSQKSQKVPPSVPKLDCLFNLDGLRLKLHRNDHLEGLKSNMDSDFCYDVVVLRADTIEVSLTANSLGDKTLQLSLSRLGVFDLGDTGRLARTRYYETLMELDSSSSAVEMSPQVTRNPCAFSVLVEGYSPTEDHVSSPEQKESMAAEPQLLLTIDTCSASSAGVENEESILHREEDSDKVVLARMVFNYMSVNALIRPLREIVAFMTCSWPLPSADRDSSIGEAADKLDEEVETSVDQPEERARPASFRKGLQLKVVAHYPRIFFLADESDPCSRALVLRGYGSRALCRYACLLCTT